MVIDQQTLFETPQEKRSREAQAAWSKYLELHRTPAGYQCRDCGGVSPNAARFWADHGVMGSRCLAELFARNHTLFDLRDGDAGRYKESSSRLRAIAAYRNEVRRTRGE